MKLPRLLVLGFLLASSLQAADAKKPNVLFIAVDDLRPEVNASGSNLVKTPNLDRIAARGTTFDRAYCQQAVCSPSRTSLMTGRRPDATRVWDLETHFRKALPDAVTVAQYFKKNGYHSQAMGKIFHGGFDDAPSWSVPWETPKAPAYASAAALKMVSDPANIDKKGRARGPAVESADVPDDTYTDGKTARLAAQTIADLKKKNQPFFLAAGIYRPHLPWYAPRKYFEPYLPYEKLTLPPKVRGDWDDLPKAGINYKTSVNMKMDIRRQKKALGGYYACVAYMDAQVGKVLAALEKSGQADNTIVIFTSDHGYHLGEHDFWAKVSLLDESSKVPLIIRVPGKAPVVCDSLVELLDLYPTVAALCGLEVPARLQGLNIARTLDDPSHRVRDTAFSVAPSTKGFLLRDDRFAYIQYQEDASAGIELYDIVADPRQYTNLARRAEHASTVTAYRERLADKLRAVRTNDLGR